MKDKQIKNEIKQDFEKRKEEHEQIEEMARCMCSSYETEKGCKTCPTNWCYADECATMAFCNGYRKIPEGAVILTREEYKEQLEPFRQRIITLTKEVTRLTQELIDKRKETAREIADWLDNEKGYCGLGYLVKRQFGVEVK